MKAQIAKTSDGEPAFFFAKSRASLGTGLALVALFEVFLIYVAIDGEPIAVILAAVLAVALITGLSRIRGEFGILLTPTRLIALHGDTIPWEAATDVEQVYSHRQHYIRVYVTDASELAQTRTMRVGPAFMNIHAMYFTADRDDIAAALNLYIREPPRRSAIGTPAELERLTAAP